MSIISREAGAMRSRWGALGMSIFILSQHRAEGSAHPQPELRATSPFPVGESSSFSLIFPKEVWKVQEESLQLPNSRRHTGVGYSEKRLIFPPIQPMSLETSESDLKKMRTFQYCGSESIANFFPSSHLAPAGTQKPSLL